MICKAVIALGISGLCLSMSDVSPLQAQKAKKPSASAIVRDTAFRTGRLPNGLTYYIRANAKPEQQAKLMLAVKAGSLQEDDDQLGMAHFLEHMAFNGTRRFKEHELIAYLESIGVRFGADLNAMTTWDRTVYEIQVPTGKPGQLLTALDILSDWTDGITIDSSEVAAERGVIVEEWRSRLSQGAHIQASHDSVMFNGALYGRRVPIGTVESIQATTAAPLKRFYQDWYRPNLMAVVVVGDVDPVAIEKEITARFAHLKNPRRERALQPVPIPANKDPLVSIVRDSTVAMTTTTISYKVPAATGDKLVLTRESIAFSIFTNTVNQRLADLTRVPNPPFRRGSVGAHMLVPGQPVFSISIGTDSESPLSSVEAVLTEVERVAQHGLSDTALKELRTSMLKDLEVRASSPQEKASGAYAQEYVEHFVTGEELRDPQDELRVYREALALVTNDDIKRAAAIWRLKDNRVFMVSAPTKAIARVPEFSSLASVIDDVERMELTQYVDAATRTDPLLPELPTPGKIVARKTLDLGITEWTLSNGIRVLLRPSTATPDMFYLSGESRGGFYRNLDSVGYVPASMATSITRMSGAGTFNAAELQKNIQGKKIASVGVSIEPYTESANALAAIDDAETALQLLNLVIRYPRVDTNAFETYRSQLRSAIANHVRTADDDFRDTVWLTMSQHHPFVREQMAIDPDKIDAQKSLQVFRDRFSDMSDFRFVLVGNFTLEQVEPLVERYIASLPGHGRVESIVDPRIAPPDGIIRKTVRGAVVDRTATSLLFFGPAENDRYSVWRLMVLQEIVKARLLERLREQLSGTYAPQVSAGHNRLPTPNYAFEIRFLSAPERADELVNATMDVLRELRTNPVSEAELNRVREATLLSFDRSLKDDQAWATRIHLFDDLKLPWAEIPNDSLLRNMTPADVLESARHYLTLDRYAHFDFVPGPNGAKK